MPNSNAIENIAFIFDDLTEFYAMREVIDHLISQKKHLDIIAPYDSGYNGMAKHTLSGIKKLGYSPKKDIPKNKKYKVLLTPYPNIQGVERAQYSYHLRFPYSTISAKPNPVYTPDAKINYDAIICFNYYEPQLLSAYGVECFSVPYWKYFNSKKPKKKARPTLLILPTFGQDTSCVQLLTKSFITQLHKHFEIIIKAHHAIHFNIDGGSSLDSLKSLGVELYDSDTPITELLQRADIVLSDNSGSIFEAIYSNTPVATLSADLNARHLGDIDTLQYQLAENGILPHSSNPKNIIPILLSMDPYFAKQQKIKNELFPKIESNRPKEFISIINSYLYKNEEKDYRKKLHDLMVQERAYLQKEAQLVPRLTKENFELKQYKEEAEKVFNSKMYQLYNQAIQPYKKIKNKFRKAS